MVPGLIILLLFLTFLLIKSADIVVVSLRRLSRETHTKVFILSSILLAIATSFPELFVGITSALEEAPHLSFGNVLGANIANISLVAGLSAFIVGKVNVQGEFIRKEVAVAAIAGLLPLILALDGKLSRVDGLILILTYLGYATSFFKFRFLEIAEQHRKESFFHRFLRKFIHMHFEINKTKEWGRLFVGIILLLISADLLVKVAKVLAENAGIPVFLVGLIVISIGTTLPELAFSLRSLEDNEPTMYFGNLLGSIIANSTLILGLVSLIYPIQIIAVQKTAIAAAAFILIFLVFWFFIRSKLKLERWEAFLLLLVYGIFIVVEFV